MPPSLGGKGEEAINNSMHSSPIHTTQSLSSLRINEITKPANEFASVQRDTIISNASLKSSRLLKLIARNSTAAYVSRSSTVYDSDFVAWLVDARHALYAVLPFCNALLHAMFYDKAVQTLASPSVKNTDCLSWLGMRGPTHPWELINIPTLSKSSTA